MRRTIDLPRAAWCQLDLESTGNTPDRRQSKALYTIDEHGSKIARNNVFDFHLSPDSVSYDFGLRL